MVFSTKVSVAINLYSAECQNDWWIGKDGGGSSHGLIQGTSTILIYAWIHLEIPWKTSVKITIFGLLFELWSAQTLWQSATHSIMPLDFNVWYNSNNKEPQKEKIY
jgi:hypothetical protein